MGFARAQPILRAILRAAHRNRTEFQGMSMAGEIRYCLPPDRNPRKPQLVLPGGSIDTHVHIFERGYKLFPGRGYNPPYSTLPDLKHLHRTLGIDRVVFTQASLSSVANSAILDGMAPLNSESAI